MAQQHEYKNLNIAVCAVFLYMYHIYRVTSVYPENLLIKARTRQCYDMLTFIGRAVFNIEKATPTDIVYMYDFIEDYMERYLKTDSDTAPIYNHNYLYKLKKQIL